MINHNDDKAKMATKHGVKATIWHAGQNKHYEFDSIEQLNKFLCNANLSATKMIASNNNYHVCLTNIFQKREG